MPAICWKPREPAHHPDVGNRIGAGSRTLRAAARPAGSGEINSGSGTPRKVQAQRDARDRVGPRR